MPSISHKIQPCLWFDDQAEQAARYYTGIFPSSSISSISLYTEAGQEIHGRPPGSVMVVAFELAGCRFTALNGGPVFTFNEALSLIINCDNQDEIDYYWHHLGEGGDPAAQQCGWLKDKYGLSWQIVPTVIADMMRDTESGKAQRVMTTLLKMRKIDFAELQKAYRG
ncbi:VOC family protein [Massilia sp. YIM B04103]|uniref:VOC family protein n=1 Tax=Massilia sp. YIM B04103 TaxID=2963106 RepID=UPI0021092818|nr:VOC family protein [Massilia sp. YIM B04103]